MIDFNDIMAIMPWAKDENINKFLGPLNQACTEFEINTSPRIRMFLANITVESGSLQYVRELDDGMAYENRRDLGNINPGDGPKYKGRGLLQVTGRDNYAKCGAVLGLDLLNQPDLLELPLQAARSAGWFWGVRNLNSLADTNNFFLVCARINGINSRTKEPNGYPDRVKAYNLALTRTFTI